MVLKRVFTYFMIAEFNLKSLDFNFDPVYKHHLQESVTCKRSEAMQNKMLLIVRDSHGL